MALGNVPMPHVFSNNRPIFPFNQCMVVALARARLGWLNTELVQPPGHDMIDELRAIIGMKAENREGDLGVGANQLRNFISFYHQAYRAAVWRSRQNILGHRHFW